MTNVLPGVGSLSTLLKRLEAATSRLEDIAMAQVSPQAGISYGIPETYIPESHNQVVSPPTTAKPNVVEEPNSVKGFQVLIESGLAKYLNLSKEIGGLVQQQVRVLFFLISSLSWMINRNRLLLINPY